MISQTERAKTSKPFAARPTGGHIKQALLGILTELAYASFIIALGFFASWLVACLIFNT